MNAPQMFARLTKIDEARREVWGRITQEVVDKVDEILDYEKSKPYFKAWSDGFASATDGKSLGNVRAMHGKVAAGKLIAINFNDAEKAIDVGAKIVDDAEWSKCAEGVYTGFSIGGKYVGDRVAEKVDGRDVHRYVADPSEVSVVDNPCVGPAKFFDVLKADGTTLQKQFKVAVAGGGGDDSGTGGAAGSAEPLVVTGTDEQVAEFAKLLNDSGKTMADVIAMLKAKPADPAAAVLDAASPKQGVAKAGFADHVQKMHDMASEMGASCGKSAAAPVTKVDEPNVELVKLRDELAKANARIEKLEKQPMPSRVILQAMAKAVTKEGSTPGAPAQPINPDTVTLEKADYIINPTTGEIDHQMSRVMKAHKLTQLAQAQ